MKKIKLTQNKVALIDDEDFERLNQFKWFVKQDGKAWYVCRHIYIAGKRTTLAMHREILSAKKDIKVDHINHDGLNNCKENLRLCTHQENLQNQEVAHKNNKLGIKGMYWWESRKKFRATINVNKKDISLGYFHNIDNADIAYRKAEVKYFGKFARESSKRYMKILNQEYQISLAG